MKERLAVFMDRDGTINEEVGYLSKLEQLRLFPAVGEAIRQINRSGMKAVVVTNQSGVAHLSPRCMPESMICCSRVMRLSIAFTIAPTIRCMAVRNIK